MSLAPMVNVLEASDIILPEIGARLHFDEEGWDFAGVRQPVSLADGDVRRLVLGKKARDVALGYRERTPYHHPVLRSVIVAL